MEWNPGELAGRPKPTTTQTGHDDDDDAGDDCDDDDDEAILSCNAYPNRSLSFCHEIYNGHVVYALHC